MNIIDQINASIQENVFNYNLPTPYFERMHAINKGIHYLESLQIDPEIKRKIRQSLNGQKYFF